MALQYTSLDQSGQQSMVWEWDSCGMGMGPLWYENGTFLNYNKIYGIGRLWYGNGTSSSTCLE